MATNRMGIGQHRSDGPAPESGQRQRRDPAANVGQLSGGENNMSVPASRRDSDIATTSHSGGPLSPGERRGGSDDQR